MDPDTSDIDAQIALLQAERAQKLARGERARAEREKEEARVLVGSTPTKSKERNDLNLSLLPKQPVFTSVAGRPASSHLGLAPSATAGPSRSLPLPTLPLPALPRQSGMSSSLALMRRTRPSADEADPSSSRVQSSRSSGFGVGTGTRSAAGNGSKGRAGPKGKERSAGLEVELDLTDTECRGESGGGRDEDDLTVVNGLKPGPREFGRDPEGEEGWEWVEPNSGIRLTKRSLAHAALQDHLSGRYFLPPSLIYSVARLSRDGATYDVPVEGDWVTIAVVAERGEVRVSGSKEVAGSDEDEEDGGLSDIEGRAKVPANAKPAADKGDSKSHPAKTKRDPARGNKEKWKNRRGPKKYINLRLCSLAPRSQAKDGTGGDALLQLLLFEADSIVREAEDENGEVRRGYRGGSGGAFERWGNLAVGNVIAILNPRVLRPLKSGQGAPHPLTLPLALNPTSGDGVTLIGQARDLGCCSAQQKDGNRCKTWVDLRQSQVCEYHMHAAIQRGRAGRAEFTASTASFALQSRGLPGGNTSGRGERFDPKRQRGLLPASGPQPAPRAHENGGGGATYVVGGNPVRTSTATGGGLRHLGDEHLSEKLGRGRAEKRKRKMEEKETEKLMERLMEREGKGGSTGAKYLAAIDAKNKNKNKAKKGPKDASGGGGNGHGGAGGGGETDEAEAARKRVFGAEAVKKIGFDPTARRGERDEDQSKRAESLRILKAGGGVLKLGRPKGLSRSNVRAPVREVADNGEGEAVERGDIAAGLGVEEGDEEDGDEADESMVDLE